MAPNIIRTENSLLDTITEPCKREQNSNLLHKSKKFKQNRMEGQMKVRERKTIM